MKKFLPLLALILVALFALVPTTTSAAIYRQGVVYVIYDETGIGAPKNKADINSNGVPDVIEDIATQVNAAREVFKYFNFTDPLACDRFKDVTSIEVDIRAKTIMKSNGKATSNVRKKSKHDPNEKALHISVANTVNPHKNTTPSHEYFHLVQFGTTHFRNKWFLEGMARWASDGLGKIKKYPDGKNIPHTLNSLAAQEKIFQSSYDASGLLWRPLAMNLNDKAKIPDSLTKKYKYVDGTPVFKDNIFYGPNVMREIMQVMKSKEHLAVANYAGYQEWRKKGRRDPRNNKIIFDCVREVYNSKQ